MMNYEEDQRCELEALREIYYNDITVTSSKTPISFTIKVRPQASYYEAPTGEVDGDVLDSEDESDGSESGEEEDGTFGPYVELRFELPEKYPDERPSIEVVASQDLEDDQLDELLRNLATRVDNSLGDAMIFMLVSEAVEWLIGITEREANEIDMEKERKQREDEQEERRKQEGTQVTVETFLAWKAKFDAEMLEAKLESLRIQEGGQGAASVGNRLTGREMFESDKTLAESDLKFMEKLEGEQLAAFMQDIEEIPDHDDELDDISDDDDDYEIVEDSDESEESE